MAREFRTRAVAALCTLTLVIGGMIAASPPASADFIQSNSTTTTASSVFQDQLTAPVTGQTFTYMVVSPSAGLTVSSAGAISTTGTLAANTYTVSGTYDDGFGDTGNWTYTLSVSGVNIPQGSPIAGSTTASASSGFGAALSPTGFNGQPVTYAVVVTNSGLTVSPAGAIATTGTLAVNSYTVSGTDANDLGDSGTWSFTLTVTADTIPQSTPTSGNTSTSASSSYVDALAPTTFEGAPVTYSQTHSGSACLSVSATGAVKVSCTLAAGPYVVSGTDGNGIGNTGVWSYTLNVAAATISQTSPTTANTTLALSSSFTGQLGPTTFNASPISYTVVVPSTGLTVSSNGAIATTGSLAANTYTVSGTDADGLGDAGTWTFTLNVGAVGIPQSAPTSANVTTILSSSFTTKLGPTSFNGLSVTYAVLVPNAGLTVSPGGTIATTGALTAGQYTVSGTDSDGVGDTGTWTYALTVTISQGAPVAGTVTVSGSTGFSAQLSLSGNTGTVTYKTTSASADLSVSPGGIVTTTGTLSVGTYTVSGTDNDASGHSGTWTYSLTVTTNPSSIVTFDPNGGSGVMAAETASAPTPLTLNSFTRDGHEFTGWNTTADGSGTTYADGSTYPFTSSTTLYAQWKTVTGGGPPAVHAVTFDANGGAGTMATERSKTPAGLTSDRYTRKGFAFVQWNTAADGSGSNFANRAQYPFTTSVTLYAQWRAVVLFAVTFNAHGGAGTMAPQRSRAPAALSPNHFSRRGFVFRGWSTSANGSGAKFANGAVFPFTSSTVLYAQWKAKRVVALPPVDAVATISLFATKSSTLSAALQSQVKSLAREIKSNRDTKIKLVGYGDALSVADQSNETKWVANFALSKRRATAVEVYLAQQLSALGVTGYTIAAVGDATAGPGSSGPSAAAKAKDGEVIATLT